MKSVLKYFKPYGFKIILLFILVTIKAVSTLLIPNAMGNVIADIRIGETAYLINHFAIMITFSLVSFIAHIFQNYVSARIISGFQYDLRKDLFYKVESLSLEEINDFETSSLITRTTNDINFITSFFTMFTRLGITIPFLGLGGAYLAIKTAKNLSWIIIVTITLMTILFVSLSVIVLPRSKKVQKLIDKLNLLSRESLTGIRVIRAFNAEKPQTDKYKEANTAYYRNNLIMNEAMALLSPMIQLISSISTVLVVYFGAQLINLSQIDVESVLVFVQYLGQIMFAFMMGSMVVIMWPRIQVSIKRIAEVLTKKENITNKEVTKEMVTKGEIEFKDVSFAYPGSDEYTLQHLNFKIKQGERVAFIGSTGSGKSTIINLIPRLFDVTKGSILVNGVDVRDLDIKKLRDAIGFIPQKANLFKGTILDNLKFSYEEATPYEIDRAIRVAQAKNFINEKEDGLNFEVSQNGKNLSGGQKQRLAIARALVKPHDFIILDDSLSALDYQTASNLQKDLDKEFKDTTIIFIAQRVSSIMNSDKIIVLNDGKIESIGTHKELLKSSKVYLEIAKSQLSMEELGL